jgi:hypothetical protein
MEVYKQVIGFAFYEVSNYGNVRSIDREVSLVDPRSGKTVKRKYKGVNLRTKRSVTDGRLKSLQVTLYIDGQPYYRTAHSLVMDAHVGRRPYGYEIAHNDGDAGNNRLDNLRYTTHRDNCLDRVRHGTENIGERNPMSILREDDIYAIRRDPDATTRDLSQRYGVSVSAINDVKSGATWAHLPR